jgi:hypothetical protein
MGTAATSSTPRSSNIDKAGNMEDGWWWLEGGERPHYCGKGKGEGRDSFLALDTLHSLPNATHSTC